MELIFFYGFATLSVGAAVGVVAFRNTLSSAFSLVASLFGIACLFVLLGAHFLAAIQLLIYAGAIMVLLIFVIMLLNLGQSALVRIKISFGSVVGILFGAYLAVFLVLRFGLLSYLLPESNPSFGTAQEVGRLFFTRYLVPFEMTSILLLIAVIGAVVLAKKEVP